MGVDLIDHSEKTRPAAPGDLVDEGRCGLSKNRVIERQVATPWREPFVNLKVPSVFSSSATDC